MPTEIVAQNGAVVDQGTRVAVTGCAKAAHRARPVKPKKHRKK
jgi:hypothetical protein